MDHAVPRRDIAADGDRIAVRKAAMLTASLGLVHALLFISSALLLKARTPGINATDEELIAFYNDPDKRRIVVAAGLYLLPFAGIAFIWFFVALRSWISASAPRVNVMLSNVQLVSGIIYTTLVLAAGGSMSVMAASVELSNEHIDPLLARQFPQFGASLLLVFAMRMAAMFVLTTTNLGRITGILPRWFIVAGFAVGVSTMDHGPATLRERWTIVDGLPLFYRVNTETASGNTPIVHLHGFGISGRYLVPTAERLARHYPTFVPDLPGYGRSHKPPVTLTIPELADALARFLDAVGVERATLLGNSMGCLVTIEFAYAYPNRIDRAILVSPAGGPHNQPLYRGLPQLARDSLRESPRILPVALPDYVRFGPICSLRLFHAMTHYPTVERALGLDVPMLVVTGARDPLVSQERMRQLVEARPNLTLVIHNRAAHAINFSHPRMLSTIVQDWLSDRPIAVDEAEPGDITILSQRVLAQIPESREASVIPNEAEVRSA